eukprot:110800-Pleurochrysis_carterae.AAC.1
MRRAHFAETDLLDHLDEVSGSFKDSMARQTSTVIQPPSKVLSSRVEVDILPGGIASGRATVNDDDPQRSRQIL